MLMNTENRDAVTQISKAEPNIVSVTIRLFGTAKQAAELTRFVIDAPSRCSVHQLTRLVQESKPALVGPVIDRETLELKPSHTFNLNGTLFIEDTVILRTGDELLLFSSQAGG
jgi:hypothetical protein